ncbi:MAG: PD40 domain-containing protein, partial [Acidobacteria bacterium]|nr:PD40 domain-containing protein [Acidobacteriota bacterium]
RVLLSGGFHWRYSPSGHLLFVHDGSLFAVAFDLQARRITGTPAPMLEGVEASPTSGGAQFAISESGLLAHVETSTDGERRPPLAWVDRAGVITPLAGVPRDWVSIDLSPAGDRVAVGGRDGQIYVYDVARENATRLTLDAIPHAGPVWSPDGRYIAYSAAAGGPQLDVRPFPGPGGKWKISEEGVATARWSPNGNELIYAAITGDLKTVPYRIDAGTFVPERPRRWTPVTATLPLSGFAFALHADGKRAIVAPAVAGAALGRARFVLMTNVFDVLRRVAPASGR